MPVLSSRSAKISFTLPLISCCAFCPMVANFPQIHPFLFIIRNIHIQIYSEWCWSICFSIPPKNKELFSFLCTSRRKNSKKGLKEKERAGKKRKGKKKPEDPHRGSVWSSSHKLLFFLIGSNCYSVPANPWWPSSTKDF